MRLIEITSLTTTVWLNLSSTPQVDVTVYFANVIQQTHWELIQFKHRKNVGWQHVTAATPQQNRKTQSTDRNCRRRHDMARHGSCNAQPQWQTSQLFNYNYRPTVFTEKNAEFHGIFEDMPNFTENWRTDFLHFTKMSLAFFTCCQYEVIKYLHVTFSDLLSSTFDTNVQLKIWKWPNSAYERLCHGDDWMMTDNIMDEQLIAIIRK